MEIIMDGCYKIPLYMIDNNEPKVLCEIIMQHYTSPLAKCVEIVSQYNIPWCLNLYYLKKDIKQEGAIYVLLEDFKKENLVNNSQIIDYENNYRETTFYKMLELNGMVDFNLPDQKTR